MSAIDTVCDIESASALADLVNDAYRGKEGEGRWTSEAHLVSGQRITPEAMAALICASNSELYVAYDDGAPIACIAATLIDGDTVELGCFAVTPRLHGKGWGLRMLAYAEDAQAQRGTKFQVTVVSKNDALISFYQKRGYCLTSERKAYPFDAGVGVPIDMTMDLVLLQKDMQKRMQEKMHEKAKANI